MSYGLYIHIPFCASKCPYCSFSSFTGIGILSQSYCRTVNQEILGRLSGPFSGPPDSLYIGGGTPSTVPANILGEMIDGIPLISLREFTVEANPESLTDKWLEGILSLGADRLSIGVQALDDVILKRLGRIHSAAGAVQAVEKARNAGFDNISIDLMFGVPGQTLEIWRETLAMAIDLNVEHMSCYSLGIEEDTRYYEMFQSSELEIPGSSLTSDMYQVMSESLKDHGYCRYEISNFSKPGFESKHNSAYWDFTPYLGAGSSSHSFDGTVRSWNEVEPRRYIEKIKESGYATVGRDIIDAEKHMQEALMLSLRTEKGFHESLFSQVEPSKKNELFVKIELFMNQDFLRKSPAGFIALGDSGIMISDEIISELLAVL